MVVKQKTFNFAKENKFAIPAVNVVGSDSVNAVLEVAAKVNSPIIIQFSNGGAGFYAGKGLKTSDAAVLGAIVGAQHVHTMAEAYGVPVILHTDHAAKKLLPWIDALLEAGKVYLKNRKTFIHFTYARFIRRAFRREHRNLCRVLKNYERN